MAVEKAELDRRKDLLKIMYYIVEADAKRYDHDAYEIWHKIMDRHQSENGIALLAADDVQFVAALRVFASVIELYSLDADVITNEGD